VSILRMAKEDHPKFAENSHNPWQMSRVDEVGNPDIFFYSGQMRLGYNHLNLRLVLEATDCCIELCNLL
jgi:hypothetical protein